jgi:hypothetical protein
LPSDAVRPAAIAKAIILELVVITPPLQSLSLDYLGQLVQPAVMESPDKRVSAAVAVELAPAQIPLDAQDGRVMCQGPAGLPPPGDSLPLAWLLGQHWW